MRKIVDGLLRGILVTGMLIIPSYSHTSFAGSGQQNIAPQYSDKVHHDQGIRLYHNAGEDEEEVARLIRKALVGDAPRKYILLADAFKKLNTNNTIDNIIAEALEATKVFETVISEVHNSEYADNGLFWVGESRLLIARLFTDVYGATAYTRIQSAREAAEKLDRFGLNEMGIKAHGMCYVYDGETYREVLENYPEGEWADNAQFRLNEALMGTGTEGYEGNTSGEAADSLKIWLPFVEKYPHTELMDLALLRVAAAYHTLAGYDGILGGYSTTRYDVQGIVDRNRRSGSYTDDEGKTRTMEFR